MDGGGYGYGGERSALAAELAQVMAMVRELEARMDQDPLPAAARELCAELASSVDRSIRIARSCCVDSPASGAGSPRSDAGNNAGAAAQSKRRKGTGKPSVRRQVRAAAVQDAAALDDGLSWRKYGQKDILGAKYPRAYFRCTHRHSQGCLATKHVQRADGDPLLHDVVYHGAHTCAQAAHPGAQQLRQEMEMEMQLQPGHEHEHEHGGQQEDQGEGRSLLALQTEGLRAGLLEPMTPYSFASAAAAGAGAGADFAGWCPLLSPTGLDWQLRSSQPAAGGLGMEFETQFEELFATNATEPFQWDLYAANYN